MNSLDHFSVAAAEIAVYQAARDRWCLAIEQENDRRAKRDERRRLIVESLVGTPNRLSGRAHSMSSASEVADADEGVREADAALDIAQQDKWRAETDYTAAAMLVELHTAALRKDGIAA